MLETWFRTGQGPRKFQNFELDQNQQYFDNLGLIRNSSDGTDGQWIPQWIIPVIDIGDRCQNQFLLRPIRDYDRN